MIIIDESGPVTWSQLSYMLMAERRDAIAELRNLGWTVFCDEEEDDVQ